MLYFIAFKTPEEFFLGHKPVKQFEWGSYNPSNISQTPNNEKTYHKEVSFCNERNIFLLSYKKFVALFYRNKKSS